ncbi:hypothetical protein B566_EDAN007969 [Ephemera danica]|nr:hypothetical protein B566_EDAN007969 [Ephemera danica]
MFTRRTTLQTVELVLSFTCSGDDCIHIYAWESPLARQRKELFRCSRKSDEQTKRGGAGNKSHSEPPSALGSPQRTGGLHSIKAALGLRLRGSPRSVDKCKESSSSSSSSPAECVTCRDTPVLRYTRFPPIKSNSSTSNGCPPVTKSSSSTSRVATALSLLRIHRESAATKQLRERSKSDNSLQRFAVVHSSGSSSRSDHALQRLLVRNSSEQHVFLPQPQHSPPPPPRQLARRSRSLERTNNFRVYPVSIPATQAPPVPSSDGSRSLERNHKFRIAHAASPAEVPSLSCSSRHAFPHCESCPLASHNQEPLRAIGGNTVLLLPPIMAAPPPPDPNGTRHGGTSFMNKPDRGWLHSDQVLARDGITYAVRDTLDFMAYVAKDSAQRRSCMVLECGGGLAQDVITTVGQAFELRFKEYLRRTPSLGTPPIQQFVQPSPTVPKSFTEFDSASPASDPDYYNDLPGKVPPDIGPPPVPPLPQYHAPSVPQPPSEPPPPPAPSIEQTVNRADSTGSNLIDLHSELPPSRRRWEHDYVNNDISPQPESRETQPANDVFDMQPFSATLPSGTSTLALQKQQLQREDGDFLVRESQGSPGQYVLTGLQGGTKKHLLLVRTKDRMFESVSHLINYHCEQQLPIISAESALLLRHPVARQGPLKTLT